MTRRGKQRPDALALLLQNQPDPSTLPAEDLAALTSSAPPPQEEIEPVPSQVPEQPKKPKRISGTEPVLSRGPTRRRGRPNGVTSAPSVELVKSLAAEKRERTHVTWSTAFGDDLRAVALATGRSLGFVIEYLLQERIRAVRAEIDQKA